MDLKGLMEKAARLKVTKRTGWMEYGVTSPESVADHSYSTALLSMILSDLQRLDTLKVLRMALIHDLAESKTGDLTPRQKTSIYGEKEANAMEEILDTLPEETRRLYHDAWREYKENTSPEARLVHNTDKLDMLYQAREYEKKGYKLDQFWETPIDKEYQKYKPRRA